MNEKGLKNTDLYLNIAFVCSITSGVMAPFYLSIGWVIEYVGYLCDSHRS